MKKPYFPFGRPQRPTERIIGLEPTLFHIGSVMPYQLGEIRVCVGGTNLLQFCTSTI